MKKSPGFSSKESRRRQSSSFLQLGENFQNIFLCNSFSLISKPQDLNISGSSRPAFHISKPEFQKFQTRRTAIS